MDTPQVVGARIASLRAGKELSRGQLAVAVRSPSGAQQVGKWEDGTHSPGAKWLVPLARALGCSVDYLLTGQEASAPAPQRPGAGR